MKKTQTAVLLIYVTAAVISLTACGNQGKRYVSIEDKTDYYLLNEDNSFQQYSGDSIKDGTYSFNDSGDQISFSYDSDSDEYHFEKNFFGHKLGVISDEDLYDNGKSIDSEIALEGLNDASLTFSNDGTYEYYATSSLTGFGTIGFIEFGTYKIKGENVYLSGERRNFFNNSLMDSHSMESTYYLTDNTLYGDVYLLK